MTSPTLGRRDLSGFELGNVLALFVALAAALGPASASLWLGVRSEPGHAVALRGTGVAVLVAFGWYYTSDRRSNHLSPAQRKRVKAERVWFPIAWALLMGAALPRSPALAAVTAVLTALMGAVVLHLALSHCVQPGVVGPVTALETVNWAIRTNARRVVFGLTLAAALGTTTTLGIVSTSALTGNSQTATDGGAEEEPCPPIDAEALGIDPDVAEAMDRAVAREGRDAGCIVGMHRQLPNGIVVAATDAEYVGLGWRGRAVAFGIDRSPFAAIWWAGAVEVPGVLDLLAVGLPGDRLDCTNGAVVTVLDEHLLVVAVVVSSDYRRWFLVPPELLPVWVRLADRHGKLPMPTGEATRETDGLHQRLAGGGELVASEARGEVQVGWTWLRGLCRPRTPRQ